MPASTGKMTSSKCTQAILENLEYLHMLDLSADSLKVIISNGSISSTVGKNGSKTKIAEEMPGGNVKYGDASTFMVNLVKTTFFAQLITYLVQQCFGDDDIVDDEQLPPTIQEILKVDSSITTDVMQVKDVIFKPKHQRSNKLAGFDVKFEFRDGTKGKKISTGCLIMAYSSVGELGNYRTTEHIQNLKDKHLPFFDYTNNLDEAQYLMSLTPFSKIMIAHLRFLKLLLVMVVVEAKLLYHIMTSCDGHPFFLKCGGGTNKEAFCEILTAALKARFVPDDRDTTMNIGSILAKGERFSFLKFRSRVFENSYNGARSDFTKLTEENEKTCRTFAPSNKIYKPLPMVYHRAFFPNPFAVPETKRVDANLGDMARISFEMYCYGEKNRPLVSMRTLKSVDYIPMAFHGEQHGINDMPTIAYNPQMHNRLMTCLTSSSNKNKREIEEEYGFYKRMRCTPAIEYDEMD